MKPLTHYEILNVSKHASFDEIKSSHRRLALLYHPDKQQRQHPVKDLGIESSISISNNPSKSQRLDYTKIQEAWECLRDDEKRRDYDIQLSKSKEYRDKERMESGMSVPVKLSDMEVELCEVEVDGEDNNDGNHSGCGDVVEQNVYLYSCRCGDCFELLESDFQGCSNSTESNNETHSFLFECQSCSLTIAVYDDVH